MSPFTRIGSYLAILLVLLTGALAMNSWLQRQTQAQIRQLDEAAIALKRAQFQQATRQLDSSTAFTPAKQAEIGQAIGAAVSAESRGAAAAPGGRGRMKPTTSGCEA